ncbi:MAG: oligosaccharide flippase family protein [Isosphaeraceae bacterium]|nr:oligosaccharide flippase family protein [Isosphaeraceae bacterium]
MATLAPPAAAPPRVTTEGRRTVRDSLVVTLGGQLERGLGTLTALALRWWLDPARLGVYTGLRLYLDNTNRTSLGVGLGAVQEIPILLAQGRGEEARRVADIAYTTNTLTCTLYALVLAVWGASRAVWLRGDPLAAEWTWGLVATAGLVVIKRYESFLIAVLRAHREFVLTTKLDVLESLVSACAVGLGLWLAGFWGLLASVAVILGVKIAYLHAAHPLRFRWRWELPTALRLLRLGLPILANTAAFGAVLGLDRALILWRVPDGARAAGLYTIALMGTSWSLDLAGRIVLVLYTAFQTTLGRTRDPAEVARQALRATEAQAPLLAAGSAVAFVVGPVFLGSLMPKYVEGLPALRPLLAGTLLLGLAWPARQMLIALDRPYRLCAATLAGLAVTALAGIVGADRAGIVGVAWGMTAGYGAVYLLTSATAFAGPLGWRTWFAHEARLGVNLLAFAAGALVASRLSPPGLRPWAVLAARCVFLTAWLLPLLWAWGRAHDWGGLRARRNS